MLAYVIPLETYPKTYNGHPFMYAALASQKRHMAVYLMNIYGNTETDNGSRKRTGPAARG